MLKKMRIALDFLGCLKEVPLRDILKRYIPRQNDEKGEKTDSQNREGSAIIVLRKDDLLWQ